MNNNNNQKKSSTKDENEEEEEEVALPGFRFHPTDEELVGFYLRRKVDKKPLSIELIEQVDIYKFDPWDLPKGSNSGGEKEGYFFCKRGRKYRNSIRPNRVTGSGFWKATGIDKPVCSSHGDCIGLKKTLVYYRGSAGKGTKTDWMMHEFRLPSNDTTNPPAHPTAAKSSLTEAEVWTLCRIFKRNVSHRKYTPDWRVLSSKREAAAAANMETSSITCSVDSSITKENYLSFGAPYIQYNDKKPVMFNQLNDRKLQLHHHSLVDQLTNINSQQQPPAMASSSNISSPPYGNQLFGYGDWDELRSVVEFAFDPSHDL